MSEAGDAATRAQWAAALEARAREHWTPARTEALARGKALLVPPGDAAPLLRAIGILDHDATLPPSRVAKYFQVNHMVALLLPALRALVARHATVRLLDAGCGRSYLTLVLAWWARHNGARIEVLGVDRAPDVIDESRRRGALAELDDAVRFEAGALDALDVRAAWARAFGAPAAIHGVIALHACDTATCDALVLGVALEAELIAVAPCCQAELARAWAQLAEGAPIRGDFAAIWRSPHLRRETAADVTDAMRVALLVAAGYDARAMEFVPAEHTRKNTLIRATPTAAPGDPTRGAYEGLRRATGGAGIVLADRLAAISAQR